MVLTELSDDELVSRIASICLESHRLTARLLVHLIEVEERRLHLRAACTSMFDFCTRKLGMSEGAAFRRLNGARLVRKFPSLLARIEHGELCLSTLVLLKPHLTEANVDELAAAVVGKTQRAIEEYLARIAPKPDAPSMITPLPRPESGAQGEWDLEGSASGLHGSPTFVPPAEAATPPSRIEPLSEERFKVQVTASAQLRDKLERARDLMRHRNPGGDLAVVLDAAVDALLEKLEKDRLGKTTRAPRAPRPTRSSKSGRVPRAVRREVFERDGERCTFHGTDGQRCPARGFLELDHIEPRALGGADTTENLRVRCRAHNRLAAEHLFGEAHVAARVDFRQRKRLEETSDEMDRAVVALARMGFTKTDARRALSVARERALSVASDPPSVPLGEWVREAIKLLT